MKRDHELTKFSFAKQELDNVLWNAWIEGFASHE